MDPVRVEQELAELRRRVSELESRLGIAQTAQPAQASQPAPIPSIEPTTSVAPREAPSAGSPRSMREAAEILRRVATPPLPTPERPSSPPPIPPANQPAFAESAADAAPDELMLFDERGCLVPASSLWTEAERRRARGISDPEAPQAVPQPTQPSVPRRTAAEMELQIGANWMAWAGALLVVLASGFFVKFAYDQGWLGLIPKSVRCLMCAALGAAMIAGGEVVLRRIGRAAAIGLFSAGLGVLYLTADASFRYFELVSSDVAFVLAFLVAMVGVAITIRGQFVVIGVLSLIGGYLAPVILGGRDNPPVAMGIYLSMLLGVGLALSAWRPIPYQIVRTTAMILHGLLSTVWMVSEGRHAPVLCVSFAAIWWVMVNAEVLTTVLRGGPVGGGARASFGATAWLGGIGAWTIATASPAGAESLGIYTGAIAVLVSVLLLLARQPLQVLSHVPRSSIEKLCVSYWTQLGVLITVAIGLHFDGKSPAQSICWLALSLGAIELGRRLPSIGASVFGLLVGSLALSHIVAVDSDVAWLREAVTVVGVRHSVQLSAYAVLSLVAIATTVAAAMRIVLASDPKHDESPTVLAGIAALGWLVWGGQFCTGGAVSLWWAVGAATLLSARRFGARQRFGQFGMAIVAIAALRWIIVDMAAARGAATWNPSCEVFLANLPIVTGLFSALLTAWCARILLCEYGPKFAAAAAFARSAAALLPVYGLSFAVEHAVGLYGASLVSIWGGNAARMALLAGFWGVSALAIVAWARGRADAVLARVGHGLAYFAAFVWMVPLPLVAGTGRSPAQVWLLLNLQGIVGLMLAAILVWTARLSPRDAVARRTAWALVGLIGLWFGSIELDRAVSIYRDLLPATAMARQAGLSVYWGLYAIAILAIGFARWQRECRWAGLALLSITAAKVLLVDMAAVAYGYRVLSFFVTGVLFIGVSVVYARLARQFAAPRADSEAAV